MSKFVFIFATLFLLAAGSAYGQANVPRGVVWQAPESVIEAERELRAIRHAGATAVRTDVLRSSPLLTLADTLGIDVYMELPVSRLPAARLLDTLGYASAVLDTVLGLAQVHPSLRNIGLSRHSDTSDSTACAYYVQLRSGAREQAPPGTRFYFTTRFVSDDACAEYVDFVLLDVVGRDDPVSLLEKWAARSDDPTPVGIGGIGTWVRSDSLTGLAVQHSPQRQARYFEEYLPPLISGAISPAPEAVFVFRWKDRRREIPNPAHDLDAPYVERYGLHTVEGDPRPSLDVVRGIYTGSQTVYAFEQGEPKRRGSPWTTLLGWGVVLMVGIFYATSPRFRHMVPRYFQAHGFFLESVREGRDVLFGASAVLLAGLGVSTGILIAVSLDTLRRVNAFGLAASWLPVPTQEAIAALLSRPAVLAILAGCVYVLVLLVWTFVLALLTKRKYGMAPSQVLMLVVWTRWPILLLLLGAAMAVAVSSGAGPFAIAILMGAWLTAELYGVGRTLFDLIRVSRIPAYLALPALILHPGVLLLTAAAISSLAYGPELTYLWHALTRT